MIFFGEADLDTMFADSPNVITANDGTVVVSGPCLFNESDEVRLETPESGGQIMHLCRAYVKTRTFGFLKGEMGCTVDGRDFLVWKRLQEGDGAVTQLLLRETTVLPPEGTTPEGEPEIDLGQYP
jgi:hypothetical protein